MFSVKIDQHENLFDLCKKQKAKSKKQKVNIKVKMACEMEKVNLNELPELFKQSEMYKTGAQPTVFYMYSNLCHFDLTMRSYKELCRTLDTLRQWRFRKTPKQVYWNVAGRENTIRQIMDDNCRDLFLRYPNFAPLLEIGILAFGETLEEKVAMARHHELENLVAFLRG